MSRSLAALILTALAFGGHVPGQGRQAIGTASARNAQIPDSQHSAEVSFEAILEAMSKLPYDIVQTRWVRKSGPRANFVGVREKLLHQVGPDGRERILVEPEALPGAVAVSPELFLRRKVLREQLYRSRAGYIFFYQSFGVHNAEEAEGNYNILPVTRTEYLGRPVERVLVYPVRWDRSIWLLDLDAATKYPLIAREFNSQAQLLSEVVVEEFKVGPDALTEGVRWWEPTSIVPRPDQDFDGPAGVLKLDESDLPPGFLISKREVLENVLTGETSYVTTMTDGVDNLFLIQRTGMDDPGKVLDAVGLPRDENTVFEYIDMNVTQYYFVTRNASFQLLGRGSLRDLRPTMARIYVKALR